LGETNMPLCGRLFSEAKALFFVWFACGVAS
jgi:hypothetical protein